MVDRVSHGQSRIPVPVLKSSPQLVHNGECGKPGAISVLTDVGGEVAVEGYENGESRTLPQKISVPKELLIGQKKSKEKGFETFLMTGDMIIKTNPSQKLRKQDGHTLERHHSDSSSRDLESEIERPTFKRSASSPDQTLDTGAIFKSDKDEKIHVLDFESTEQSSMNRKPSAESGFEDQALSSDTGTLEKNKRLPGDPNSVSDLSEVESDELHGVMTESQSSAVSSSISGVSTPSDLLSDISGNTVLRQEMEPLLNADSSSSIEISSPESGSGELTPDMILERSMSDSGGMSPTSKDDISKFLISSKSAEKISIKRAPKQETSIVRPSKSHENYFQTDSDLTLVCIDIDDTTYSLDQIPQPLEKSPTCTQQFSTDEPERVDEQEKDKVSETVDDRVFMPGFISIEPREHDKESQHNHSLVTEQVDTDLYDGRIGREVTQDTTQTKLPQNEYTDGTGAIVHSDGSNEDENGEIDFETDALFYTPPPKSVDRPSARRLAKRLYYLDGFRKSDVSRHLSKKNDFSTSVAEEYLKFFVFTGDTLDGALRKFLKQFSLTGETQERERVLAHFSRQYMLSNPGTFNSEDACHTLVCAIMLLNTDLHGQNVGRKMTCGEFIENLAELNDGENFPKDVLKTVYQAIKAEPIEWAPDEEFKDIDIRQDEPRAPPPSAPSLPQFVTRNPFLSVPDPSQTTEYKKGYIMRKCCMEADGRKTPVGKRSWKMYFVVLKDMILYLHKDEQGMKKSGHVEHNVVRVHHCLASKASDYTKKQHVFRLQTADWAQYLFQTSNSKELQEWIDTINYVAAMLSAPPLPGAVGSQKKFQRPLMPSSYTKFVLQDQLKNHEELVLRTELELQDHRSYPPEKGSKARIIQDYLEKENFLEYDIKRLKTYIYLLKSKLATQLELEPSLVETTIGEDEEGIQGVGDVAPKKSVQRSLSDRGTSLAIPDVNPSSAPQLSSSGEYINQETEVTHL